MIGSFIWKYFPSITITDRSTAGMLAKAFVVIDMKAVIVVMNTVLSGKGGGAFVVLVPLMTDPYALR